MVRLRHDPPPTIYWMAGSFLAALVLTMLILSVEGFGERALDHGLMATARLSFFFFLPAYLAAPLTAVFGPVFTRLTKYARNFGLSFASAHVVHLGLVAALCLIDKTPPMASFLFFGVAALLLYLIALLSIGNLQRRLPPWLWRLLLAVGMNYIMFAFAADFLREPLVGGFWRMIIYLPFQFLSVAAIFLRLCVLATLLGRRTAPSAMG